MGDYVMNDMQKRIRQLCREFSLNELIPTSKEYDIEGRLNEDAYRKAVEIGFTKIAWGKEYGGLGLDTVTQVMVTEELSYGDAGFANVMVASSLAARPVLMAGTEEQKQFMADIVIHGGKAAFCLTEANAGSDAGAIRTSAKKTEDGYIINGSKCFITNGPEAEVYIVFAMTDNSKGVKGISAFLVPGDTPGVGHGAHEDKVGIRQSSASDVIFQDVKVPFSALLGKEGEGFKIAMKTLDIARIDCAAAAVGIAQRAIDLSVKYAKERKTFGKPIAKLQAIQFMIADMEIQTEAARALVRQAAELKDMGQINSKICACAKAFAGDTAVRVATDAVQIYGGYGYIRDYPVEKLMRDAKIFQIFDGTNQIQRVVIAGNMLK
ncbi:MAG: acyl-CoA dehydrogenase family protein [Firmicutes bacterium]|nr:acyl-CoA dehydrogenase family protein [Bacillota bacterium]